MLLIFPEPLYRCNQNTCIQTEHENPASNFTVESTIIKSKLDMVDKTNS